MADKFEMELEKLGIQITAGQKKMFDRYYTLLTEWNKVMNLTGITDYDEVNLKHFTDSLTIVKVIHMNGIKRMIDVGTGAGFPGIPVKIVFPETEVILLDSLNKRIKFLDTVIEELELNNIHAVHGRAEELAKNRNYRERFDLCVSRAVANLSTLSEYCLPFVKPDGYFVSYKSGTADDEIVNAENALNILGGKIESAEKFFLPNTDMGRTLIKIKKIKSTPGKYPRKAGIPGKEPL